MTNSRWYQLRRVRVDLFGYVPFLGIFNFFILKLNKYESCLSDLFLNYLISNLMIFR